MSELDSSPKATSADGALTSASDAQPQTVRETAQRSSAPYEPLNQDHLAHPRERLALARRECPVSTPYPRVHVVARHEDVLSVFRNNADFSARGNFTLVLDPPYKVPTQITALDPPEHSVLRKFLRRWFTPGELRKQRSNIERIVADLVGLLPTGESVDLVSHLARRVPARTVYAFVGMPEEDWEDIQSWTDTVHEYLPNVPPGLPARKRLYEYIDQFLADRAAHGSAEFGDVADGLVYSTEPKFSLNEAAVHVSQILTAGTATTTALITNLLHELLVEPGRWQALVADRSGITAAVEESLRHDPPLQYVMRTVATATTISDCPVSPGDRMVLSLQSANHDETVWGEDSAMFRPGRPPVATHVAFGYGIHTCLGAPLARLEATVVLDELLRRFPAARLRPAYRWEAAREPMLRRPRTLDVIL